MKAKTQPGSDAVTSETKTTDAATAFDLTKDSRASFRALLEEKEVDAILSDLDQGKMTVEQACTIANAVKDLAAIVATGEVSANDLIPFNKAAAQVMSKHTRTGRWLGGISGALLGCCIGGMLGMLCGPAAPFTVPAFMAIGTIVGGVLGGVSLGIGGAFLGGYLSKRRNPHAFHKIEQAAENVMKERNKKPVPDALLEAGFLITKKD